MSYGSTAYLQTVLSDRVARAFDRSAANRAVALSILKTNGKVRYTGLLHKLKPSRISVKVFGCYLFFLRNRHFPVVMDGKSDQNSTSFV